MDEETGLPYKQCDGEREFGEWSAQPSPMGFKIAVFKSGEMEVVSCPFEDAPPKKRLKRPAAALAQPSAGDENPEEMQEEKPETEPVDGNEKKLRPLQHWLLTRPEGVSTAQRHAEWRLDYNV